MDEKGSKTPKRDRYWSIMLVGDHGRVIPFRHFKALTFGVCLVLVLSLTAVAGLGFLYRHQHHQMIALQKSLEQTDVQISKLRDEKDLCLAEMIAMKKEVGELPAASSADSAKAEPEKPQAVAKAEEKQKVAETKAPAPSKPSKPEVKWAAEISHFKVSYDNRQRVLKAEFRLYNRSTPKKTLTGRTVLVFKQQEDPPIHWTAVPSVPLKEGKPVGDHGKSFRINNYRTEHFAIYRRNGSSEYDTASIFVFSEHGKLIANSEMPFRVDYTPPKPVPPVEPKPPAAPEKSTAPAAGQIEKPSDAQTPKTPATAPAPAPDPQALPQQEETPASRPSPQDVPAAPDSELQTTDNPGQAQTAAEPEKSPAVAPAPAAEPKPAPEGGQQ